MERQFVVPKDVCRYTQKTERHAQKLLKKLKFLLGKEKHQLITRKELADYWGVEEATLKPKKPPPRLHQSLKAWILLTGKSNLALKGSARIT